MEKWLISLAAVLIPFSAGADIGEYRGKPNKLLTDAVSYGYCMARFPDINITLPGCHPNYVSFGCKGDTEGLPKAAAAANWQSLQLAFVTGNSVFLVVDSSKTYNQQFCVVKRVDVDK